ncbi:MAG: hypothetical protein ACYDBV_04360 [Nitrospiria bacterium]
MDESEILKKIQEVETEVEELTRQAFAVAEEKVIKAREEADRLFLERREKIERDCELRVETGKLEREKEAALMIEAAKRGAQDLKAEVKSKMEAGSRHVLKSVYPDLPENIFQ